MRPDEPTLLRLMHSSLSGDREAYVALLRACRLWLERYYARKLPPHQIDDLVQDTLIALHTKRATFDPARPFLPWLAAIARYRWVDHLRRQRHHASLDDVSPSVEPEDEAVLARLSLDAMLGALAPKQALAIRLVKIEGLSVDEASARCGQSAVLVRVNVHRGLRKLAALVEGE
jgi:RNA polymerase sigma-70 factor (ECF subfamily)